MKKTLFLFLALFLILLSPVVFLGFNAWWGKAHLQKAEKAFRQGDFQKAQAASKAALTSFQRARSLSLPLVENLSFVKRIDWFLNFGQDLAEASLHLSRAGQLSQKIPPFVLGEDSFDFETLLGQIKGELSSSEQLLSLLSAELKKKPFLDLEKKISLAKEQVEMAQDLLSLMPEIIALSGRKTYLILLQNNMELRATGGFIGSYALAIFEKGRLLDFQVEDVYTADGQLKGHVEPPEAIKEYLGEASWYLRDANFEPDFSETAKKVKWFFQKETGRAVDGVIGVNVFVAQKILEAIGPVELPDYSEKIGAENLFERAEYYSEVEFFPGSTQKRDFLGALARQIFEKMTVQPNWLKIAAAIRESLTTNQILVNLEQKEAMRVIRRYGWAGEMKKTEGDYLMVVESNFGVNKSNYFLKRNFNYEVELKEGKATLRIDYQNNSPTQTWPGGVYKNYLRVYTPLNSQLLEVKINGETISREKIEVAESFGKTVFAFLVEVPVGEKKKVTLVYTLPFDFEKGLSYSLYWQKQSGIGDDPLAVLLSFPSSLKPVKVEPKALTGPGTILYNTNLEQDRILKVEFRR